MNEPVDAPESDGTWVKGLEGGVTVSTRDVNLN